MRQTAAMLLLLLAGAIPGRAGSVDGYTILLGNNTDKPCSVIQHFKSGDKWETRGWWTIEPRKISTLAKSTDDEQGDRYFYAELLPQTPLSREVAYRDV